jgi:uncharacterized protein (TIGR00730 family)
MPNGSRSNSGRDDAAEIARLADDIKLTADEIVREKYDRGDVKLLSRSFRELKDCVAMLAAYRNRLKVTVFGSARTKPDSVLYNQARDFGRLMAAKDYLVITGAGPGIMEAAHEGAGRDASMGFNIRLPFEQGANPIVEGDAKLRTLNYFFTRKLLFLKEAHAVVLFPGGFGTLDEGFEVLTLLQTGRAGTLPVVMIDAPGGSYWKDWKRYVEQELLAAGWVSQEDMSLFHITDGIEDAVAEIDKFYRVYHSQRYVAGKLVLRLRSEVPDEQFDAITDKFSDILLPGGRFSRVDAHHHERNEPLLHELPRLKLDFNRRNFGRLRELIDWINFHVPLVEPENISSITE